MFPLGTPLMPNALLPLHVFEPRYLEMIDRILVSPVAEFGVVMIERGREVGGGDVRSKVGSTARIVDVREIMPGRLAVLAMGERRIEVVRWMDDDPYPIAEVRDWPDEDDVAVVDSTSDLIARRLDAERGLERVWALAAELGAEIPERVSLDELGLSDFVYAVATLAPLGASDRYRLLRTPGARQRLDSLLGAIVEVEDSLRFRLSNPDRGE